MKIALFGAALVSTVLAASVATAADMPVKAPVLSPAWNWTGFYWGGNGGYSWGRATTDFSETTTVTSVVTATTTGNPPLPLPGNGATAGPFTSSAAGSAAADMPGWLGGVQAGFNQQYDWWVLGIEGDLQITDEKDDPTFCGIPGCPVGSLFGSSSSRLSWFGTIRGRIGPTFTPDPNFGPIFLYVTGGLAFGEIDSNFSEGIVGGSAVNVIDLVTTKAGWTIGAGGEGRINGTNWSFKLEYLYIDFGNVGSGGINGSGAVVTPFGINNSDQIHFITTTTVVAGVASTHVTDQIFRAGLNYHVKPWN